MKKRLMIIFITLLLLVIGNFMLVEAYNFGAHDLGGKTVTIIYDDQPMMIDPEGEEVARVENEFNCNLEFIFLRGGEGVGWRNKYEEVVVPRLLAGEADYDIWHAKFQQPSTPWPLVMDGMVYPVGDILDDEYYNEFLPQPYSTFAQDFNMKGNIYGFGFGVQSAGGIRFIPEIIYNPDIFEEKGLPDLQELYEAGEWTLNTLKEIAIEATEEDVPAIADGFGGRKLDAIVPAFGGSYARYMDGEMKATLTEPAVVSAAEWITELVEREAITWDTTRTAFVEGEHPMLLTPTWYLYHLNQDAEFDYKAVPAPKPEGETDSFIPMVSNTMMLPATSEEPEAMVAIYHALFSAADEEKEINNYFRNNFRDRKSYEIFTQYFAENNYYYVAGGNKDVYGIAFTAIDQWEIYAGEESVTAILEAQNPELQAVLDDIFN